MTKCYVTKTRVKTEPRLTTGSDFHNLLPVQKTGQSTDSNNGHLGLPTFFFSLTRAMADQGVASYRNVEDLSE